MVTRDAEGAEVVVTWDKEGAEVVAREEDARRDEGGMVTWDEEGAEVVARDEEVARRGSELWRAWTSRESTRALRLAQRV